MEEKDTKYIRIPFADEYDGEDDEINDENEIYIQTNQESVFEKYKISNLTEE